MPRSRIRVVVRQRRARKATARRREARLGNLARAKSMNPTFYDRDEFERAVQGMTNSQRHAWSRRGCPGRRERDIGKLEIFEADAALK